MRRKAIFFDRDNTLMINDGYLGDPERVKLMPGAADAIARGRALGFAIVVISNQSGVARGLFDERAVRAVNSRMEELLEEENADAIIDHHEYCPFHPDGVVEKYRSESDLRKPKAGMIYRAREALGLDLADSWVIGDTPRDIDAGRSAGCRTIFFEHPDVSASADATRHGPVRAEHVSASLGDAIDFIQLTSEATSPTIQEVERELAPAPATAATISPPPEDRIASAPAAPADQATRLESLMGEILAELRRAREPVRHMDFSLARLLAGIIQVIVIAVLLIAYLDSNIAGTMQTLLLLAVVLQAMVIAALVAGRK